MRFESLTFPVLLVAILGAWRITHLFWGEDGPGRIFVRLRRAAGSGGFARLLDCFYCLSLWVAAPIAWLLAGGWVERGLLWVGISGGAILLERITGGRSVSAPPATWLVERDGEEEQDVLLR